ncbi:M23 family metallopeptidase [Pseudomonadota bacterium]|nr:M23 family metallopeptidase [Pseudomonadota bacterium]
MNNRFNLFLIFFSIFLSSCSLEKENTACLEYESQEEEFANVQIVGEKDINLDFSSFIATYQTRGEFSGSLGDLAEHEGLDLFNIDKDLSDIPIHTIAEGVVVYARTGCPSSTQFSDNTTLRECGAGWGNHLVIDHGNNIYSRYGHMRFGGVYKSVGDKVNKDEIIGLMGNSGRSEGRHLHLEIGYYSGDFDSCEPSKSFDFVVNPAIYGF